MEPHAAHPEVVRLTQVVGAYAGSDVSRAAADLCAALETYYKDALVEASDAQSALLRAAIRQVRALRAVLQGIEHASATL